jgi:tetratricopeptide (TPR) repeat protein
VASISAIKVRASWRARAPLAAAITGTRPSANGLRDDSEPVQGDPVDEASANGNPADAAGGNVIAGGPTTAGPTGKVNGHAHKGGGDAQDGHRDPQPDRLAPPGDSAADPRDPAPADEEWPAESTASTADGSESAYDLLQRGTELLRDRHNAQAAVVLERASRLEQGKGSILEALGRAYFNSGQHARAAETFQALLEVDPSAHYGHFALGLSLARLGRTQEARTHLRLAVALQPTSETYQRALDRLLAAEP